MSVQDGHTLTLIQYAAAHGDDFYARNPEVGVPRARYDRLYPPESRWHEWYAAILAAIKAGATIRRQVCDDLYRRNALTFWGLTHDFGMDWWPDGYVNPDLRAERRETQ